MLRFKLESIFFDSNDSNDSIQKILDERKEEENLADEAMRQDEHGQNPPGWAVSESIWEKAKKAVLNSKKSYKNPWPVIVHVYRNMGGKIKGK